MSKSEEELYEMAEKYKIEIVGKYIGATSNIKIVANCRHEISRTPQEVQTIIRNIK